MLIAVGGKQVKILEFDAMITREGDIDIPSAFKDALREHAGGFVRVRLTDVAMADALRRKDVGAEELDRIARVQHASREQVVTFLLTEGVLAGKAYRGGRRRMPKTRRRSS